MKMEYWKITNLLDTTSDKVLRFITKNWIEVHDQSGGIEDRCKPSKQKRIKTPMLQSDLCNLVMHTLLLKELLLLQIQITIRITIN